MNSINSILEAIKKFFIRVYDACKKTITVVKDSIVEYAEKVKNKKAEEISEDSTVESDIGVVNFIWSNTTKNVDSQRYYLGAELYENFLTFYFVDSVAKKCHIIQSYELADEYVHGKSAIESEWFIYSETSDKDKIMVFPKFDNAFEIMNDQFVLGAVNRILEISIPKLIIKTFDE